MSYLGSLLGSYEAGEQKPKDPAPSASRPRPKPQDTNSAATSSSSRPLPTAGVKRKADDSLTGDNTKLQRAQTPLDNNPKAPSRPVSAPPQQTSTQNGPTKPPPPISGSTTGSAKPRSVQAAAAAAPPAKGSFAEIMARAKALQSTKLGQGPKIMHKATPKSKDEPKERKKELDAKMRGKAVSKGRPVSRSGSEDPSKSNKNVLSKPKTKAGKIMPEKPKRKPIEVSYKGTMRPNPAAQPAYRGTAKAPLSRSYERDGYGRRYSDDMDEDDDEEDYDSGASSDMEAGAWDLDEEEEFSARKAKAEDAAAKREEEELKRIKMLRKQGLAPGGARRRL